MVIFFCDCFSRRNNLFVQNLIRAGSQRRCKSPKYVSVFFECNFENHQPFAPSLRVAEATLKIHDCCAAKQSHPYHLADCFSRRNNLFVQNLIRSGSPRRCKSPKYVLVFFECKFENHQPFAGHCEPASKLHVM